MQELRILNGLHRGATLPLDGAAVLIGSAETADVVMVDHGIAAEHARLVPVGAGWLLSAAQGTVQAAGAPAVQPSVDMVEGDCVLLGDSGIWIAIERADAPWQAPPVQPVRPDDDIVGPALSAREGPEPAMPEAEARPAPRRVLPRLLAVPVVVLAVLGAAAAYAYSTRPVLREAPASAAGRSPKAAATPAPEALRAAFRRRLADAGLLERFDLQLGDARWTMRADLDDEEAQRFDRILARFLKEHQVGFPVDARIVGPEAMLPFRISQVVSGANPALVTDDGHRLDVGAEYRGVRLVEVSRNRLTFMGKRRIEVAW